MSDTASRASAPKGRWTTLKDLAVSGFGGSETRTEQSSLGRFLHSRPNGTGDAHSLPNQQARAGWPERRRALRAAGASGRHCQQHGPAATAAPAAPHPPGDFRRRLVMRTRTSCSAALRVAAARIPAGGGRSLISGHSAPHSPVLRTWEIGCFTTPPRGSLFPRRGTRSPRKTGCRRAEGNARARVFALVTAAAISARRSSLHRRADAAYRRLDAPLA